MLDLYYRVIFRHTFSVLMLGRYRAYSIFDTISLLLMQLLLHYCRFFVFFNYYYYCCCCCCCYYYFWFCMYHTTVSSNTGLCPINAGLQLSQCVSSTRCMLVRVQQRISERLLAFYNYQSDGKPLHFHSCPHRVTQCGASRRRQCKLDAICQTVWHLPFGLALGLLTTQCKQVWGPSLVLSSLNNEDGRPLAVGLTRTGRDSSHLATTCRITCTEGENRGLEGYTYNQCRPEND